MEILRTLKARRLQLGISQQEMARRVEVTPATLSRWETGNIDPPLSKVLRYATEVGVTFQLQPEDMGKVKSDALSLLTDVVVAVPEPVAQMIAAQAVVAMRSDLG
jgi:transcriptional regulator with XRE-family HTH domain